MLHYNPDFCLFKENEELEINFVVANIMPQMSQTRTEPVIFLLRLASLVKSVSVSLREGQLLQNHNSLGFAFMYMVT